MKEEIKEILEELKEQSNSKYVAPLELIDIECKLLLDYITNLQEEIERQSKAQVILDNQLADMQGEINNLQEENERLKKELNTLKISEEEWLDETLGGDKE